MGQAERLSLHFAALDRAASAVMAGSGGDRHPARSGPYARVPPGNVTWNDNLYVILVKLWCSLLPLVLSEFFNMEGCRIVSNAFSSIYRGNCMVFRLSFIGVVNCVD